MTMVDTCAVCGGVDTHLDFHVAACLDHIGGLLGIESFETTEAGYRKLLDWLGGFGTVVRVGVEGTGSYGTGLARFLHSEGIEVVEVDRPNRQLRHRHGKSDPTDALAAARAALSGQATGTPKLRTSTGPSGSTGRSGTPPAISVSRTVTSSPSSPLTRSVPSGEPAKPTRCSRPPAPGN